MNNILYEDNHLLVIEKKIDIPVQADNSHDKDVLTMVKEYVKEKYHKPGNVYVGLVHRLDRPVGGVMVFAKTSKASSRLSKQISSHQFTKKYVIVVDGIPSKKEDILKDSLLKNEKTNTVTVSSNGKEAILSYQVLATVADKSLIEVDLKTGRSHQIRVQFSSRNLPIYGDQRYNKKAEKGKHIALFAYSLSFSHPITQEKMTFTLEIPKRYPYSLFQK